jgi:hypothetical protein
VSAVDSGPDGFVALGRWFLARVEDGTPRFVDLLRPRLFHEGLCEQELSRLPVERVVEPVAARHHDELARASADGSIDQHRHLRGVPVARVMGRELEVPLHRARVGIDREQ